MSDHFFDDFNNDFNNEPTRELESPLHEDAAKANDAAQESSYEWNAGASDRGGEYHYSFVNGNNRDSAHNPNRYDDYAPAQVQSAQPEQSANPYSSSYTAPRQTAFEAAEKAKKQKAPKAKKTHKSASRGFVAAALAIAVLGSTALGFGGGYMMSKYQSKDAQTAAKTNASSGSSGSQMNLTVATGSNSESTGTSNAGSVSVASSTSEIVKKTANSVVEIATEGVTTGTFARQYVTRGAGSGVIITEDGYIVTNHHVIEDANKITVTLRDGDTTYDAELIGSDADNDIALLKIDASGLTAATFGNSSDLVVGDYVVAIGNPLGTLGGTVTDGIISALAREVTIEDKNLTLLQTNAQISPGNSGGGLFNANGELIGIVNAKDSATEVEGIAFAIPINNVVGIIKDLKEYGYVTGKISTGMEFVDISSDYAAFYYGVQDKGVYVLSVTSGSNADDAGFKRGDQIVSVNGTEVSTEDDITKALEDNSVGDVVDVTVNRNGREIKLSLKLDEYIPSVQPNDNNSKSFRDYQSNDDFWSDIIDW